MSVACECCVLSGRCLSRADHSSRGVLPSVLCLNECDREAPIRRRPWPTGVCGPTGSKSRFIKSSSINYTSSSHVCVTPQPPVVFLYAVYG
jgi:hypothetical protein